MDIPNKSFSVRVLHLNTASDWRGGERQVYNLALGLKKDSLAESLVVVQPGSDLEKRCIAAGIECRAVRMRGELDIFAAQKIVKIADSFGANIIHTHTGAAHTLGLLVKRKRPELKLVVSRRVDFPAGKNLLSQWKYHSALVDKYVAVSENVGRVLIQDGIDSSKIEVVHSGIDPDSYPDIEKLNTDGVKREFRIKNGEMVIGNVGALVEHKDQKTLIDAFALFLSRRPPGQNNARVRLFIVGSGKLEGELRAQAKALNLVSGEDIIFTGYREDVLDFYGAMDIFVMSSEKEGLGTAVLDAMYYGLPIISTDAGGLPEMVDHEKGGFLSPVGDASSMATAIANLCDSPEKREKMGEYNRKKILKFTSVEVVRKTAAIYRTLLQ